MSSRAVGKPKRVPAGEESNPRSHARSWRSSLDFAAGRRAAVVVAVGLAAGACLAFIATWPVAVVAGWDVAAFLFLLTVWLHVGVLDAQETRSHATREDDSRVGAGLLLLIASVASLVGTAFDLIKASRIDGFGKVALTAIAVLTVVLSWAVVHTVFTLRYAHEYYAAPIGGIDFKNAKQAPDYRDFAYVAFTVGMTFQVSDTDIQEQTIRRSVLRQALIAYLFGAVIVAVTINVIAQFF